MKSVALCVFLSAAGLFAQSSGGPYSITAASLDPAGGRSTTAAYRHDSNLGATASQTASTVAYQGAAGFSSMLRDAVGFQILPGSVAEAAATQLSLRQVLDDGTQTSVSAAAATWGLTSGPASVNTTGLLTTQNVAAATDATLQITFSGFTAPGTVTVQNSIPDNFGPYASDGLDDGWQVQYFGANNPLAAPNLDPDGDGHTNLFEFTAGLVPTSGTSRFTIILEAVPSQPGQKRLVFQPAVNGRTFTLQKSTTLAPGSWVTVSGASVSGNNGSQILTDTAAADPRSFYRVQINVP
jgi:hypothetical protein